MEKIIVGAVFGGLIGGVLTFVSEEVKKKKEEVKNLGYDWTFIKGDPSLTTVLYSLKSFKHADEKSYYEIGENCNALISLYINAINPSIEADAMWSYNSFKYRIAVGKALQTFSENVSKIKRTIVLVKKNKDSGNKKQNTSVVMDDKNVNIEEFKKYADEIFGIVVNYDCSIREVLTSIRMSSYEVVESIQHEK